MSRVRFCISLFLLGLVIACGGPERKPPDSILDTPEASVERGRRLADEERLDEAQQAFAHAIGLDPKSQDGWVGAALVDLLLGDLESSREDLAKARDLGDETVFLILVRGRLQAALGKNERALKLFTRAAKLAPSDPEPLLRAGDFRASLGELRAARGDYLAALELDPSYTPAREALREIEKLEATTAGLPEQLRRLAGANDVTREEVAALIAHEFDLAALFPKPAGETVSFQPPGADERKGEGQSYKPIDVPETLWSRHAIEDVVARGVMTLDTEGLFNPDREVTRADLAVVLVRLISAKIRDDGLETRYLGTRSGFVDVLDGHYAMSAIRVVTGRGLMQADESGYFRPADPVSGVELLALVRAVQDERPR